MAGGLPLLGVLGTLTFFASAMPTYLVDRWHVDAVRASMVYTPLLVVCVAITRPLGGWLANHFDALKSWAGCSALWSFWPWSWPCRFH